MSNWDIEDLRNYIKKNPDKESEDIRLLIKSSCKKTNKYRNNKFVVDGIQWDSSWEYQRYCELLMLEKAGEIRELRRQVPFKLLNECIREVNGKHKKQRAVIYFADFVYFDKVGNHIVEDAKNVYSAKKDRTYINKRKMFLSKFGSQYRFQESFCDGTIKEY